MKNLFCGLMAAALCLCGAARAESNEGGISVSGTGRVSVKPDFALVHLSVITEGETAEKASAANKVNAAKLLKSLADLKVEDKDIQTCDVHVSPKYVYNKDRTDYTISGYQATNTVRVFVRDLKNVGKVLDQAGTASRVSGIHWDVNDRSKVADAARKLARADARRKADLYAADEGVTLGKLKILSESSYGRNTYARAAAVEPASSDGGVPTSPGEVDITVQINVTYSIK